MIDKSAGVLLWLVSWIYFTQAAFLASWQFDIFSAAHWLFLTRMIGQVWQNGQTMQWSFILALIAAALIGAAGILPSMAAAKRIKLAARLRWLATILIIVIARPAGMLYRLLSAGAHRLTQCHTVKPVTVVGHAAAVADTGTGADGFSDEQVRIPKEETLFAGPGGLPVSSTAPEPEAEEISLSYDADTLTGPEPEEIVPGVPGPEVDQTDGETDGEKVLQMQDIRSKIQLWFNNKNWQVFPDLYVNAEAGGGGFNQPFNDDPTAHIDMIALGALDVLLIQFVDLRGLEWQASPWRFPADQNSWQATGGDRTLACPVLAMTHARYCFNEHHAVLMEQNDLRQNSIQPMVIFFNGEIINWQELEQSLEQTDFIIIRIDDLDDLEMGEFLGSVQESSWDSAGFISSLKIDSAETKRLIDQRQAPPLPL